MYMFFSSLTVCFQRSTAFPKSIVSITLFIFFSWRHQLQKVTVSVSSGLELEPLLSSVSPLLKNLQYGFQNHHTCHIYHTCNFLNPYRMSNSPYSHEGQFSVQFLSICLSPLREDGHSHKSHIGKTHISVVDQMLLGFDIVVQHGELLSKLSRKCFVVFISAISFIQYLISTIYDLQYISEFPQEIGDVFEHIVLLRPFFNINVVFAARIYVG